jgi:hypothetical protein
MTFIRITLVLLVLLSAQGAGAQEPTLAETTRWLEVDGKALMKATGSKLDRRYNILTVIEHEVIDLKLEECNLHVVSRWHSEVTSPVGGQVDDKRLHMVVPMKSVDIGGFTIVDLTVLSETPVQLVSMRLQSSEGAAVRSWTEGREGEESMSDGGQIFVRGRPEGERIINALRRAAVLCGAPRAVF